MCANEAERNPSAEIAAAAPPPAGSTLAAAVTAPGRGAIAVVQVRGPVALSTVAEMCSRDADSFSRDTADGRLWIGRWRGRHGEPVVVHVCRADLVEISCHGGPMPTRKILADLALAGVPNAPQHEYLRRACATAIEAEAIAALAAAPTLRAAEILLAQFRGALSDAVRQIHDLLRHGRDEDAAARIGQLLDRSGVGLHLVTPWRVAIVGRPNVGKSSLLNALVGFNRAIVHPTPGTTRDLVTAATAIDGWAVELVDSAGLRATADAVESAGMERARRAIEQSDLQLVVLDRSREPSSDDHEILQACLAPVVVANKIDLPAAWDLLDHSFAQLGMSSPLAVSATTGEGLDRLIDAIGRRLVPQPPDAAAGVPFTPRHVAALHRSQEFVRASASDEAIHAMDELIEFAC